MHTIEAEQIQFSNGNQARLVRAAPNANVNDLIKSLGLASPRALMILNGGTASFKTSLQRKLARLFGELALFIIQKKITVITGGTDSGIFSIFGTAISKIGRPSAPCIGITVSGKATLAQLEPNHTHFILIDGEHWGDETQVMYRLAKVLGTGCHSIAVYAGGGEITIQEMLENVRQNREMILIEGSKGSTDLAADSQENEIKFDERINQIMEKGRILSFQIDGQPSDFCNLVREKLLPKTISL